MAKRRNAREKDERTGSLGFEDELWKAADLLRNNMDPAEYKHVVLGLLFLKYIDDAFEERRDALRAAVADPRSDYFVDDPAERDAELAELQEERGEYAAEGVFWVPRQARWTSIRAQARQATIGKVVDDAMDAIEKENPALDGVLPKLYALATLDEHDLGELIDLVSGIGLGTRDDRDRDTLGRVYEYFLSRFASAEGKGGGEFYTPTSVVRLLVELLEPYEGRVYDPCCGSGGMFVQSLRFIDAHGGGRDRVTIYGQESNATTWRMARMNMAIRGISANLGQRHADSFHEDLHPDLRADYVLANPPFNTSKWGASRLADDVRWTFGPPRDANANFAWLQHIVHHLSPTGVAAVVLANGSLSSHHANGAVLRRSLVEADVVDCVVWLSPQLFYSTQIAVCVWVLTRSKAGRRGRRRREGETLFIDARHCGALEDRTHRVMPAEEIAGIATIYHDWRDRSAALGDVPGVAAVATSAEIADHDYALVPGRYVPFAPSQRRDWDPLAAKQLLAAARTRTHATEALTSEMLARVEAIVRG